MADLIEDSNLKKDVWYVIINPHAGSGRTMSFWNKAERMLAVQQIAFHAVLTHRKYHAVSIARDAAAQGYRKIVAVGGDGTVHEVLTGIMSYLDELRYLADAVNGNAEREEGRQSFPVASDFTLGAIPIGSGNDWIRSVGIPDDVEKAVGLIAHGRTSLEDVVRVVYDHGNQTCHMANIGGFGFDAAVCLTVNSRKAEGYRSRTIYINSLIYNLLHYKSTSMEVICDSEVVHSGKCFTIAVGNGKYSGGGLRQTSRQTAIDDGLLDVTVVPDISRFTFLSHVSNIFRGTLAETDVVKAFRCRKIEVRPLDSELSFCEIDGEIVGNPPVSIEVTGEKIKIVAGSETV